LLPGQDADSCVRFLEHATACYREQGIVVERVLSDNGKAYHARSWIDATQRLAIERRYTRIYRPRTNGKAERLIQTLLREWAHARSYRSANNAPAPCRATSAVQPTQTAQRARRPTADQPRLTPLWSRHLSRSDGRRQHVAGEHFPAWLETNLATASISADVSFPLNDGIRPPPVVT
jgi:transposase InsO family protein